MDLGTFEKPSPYALRYLFYSNLANVAVVSTHGQLLASPVSIVPQEKGGSWQWFVLPAVSGWLSSVPPPSASSVLNSKDFVGACGKQGLAETLYRIPRENLNTIPILAAVKKRAARRQRATAIERAAPRRLACRQGVFMARDFIKSFLAIFFILPSCKSDARQPHGVAPLEGKAEEGEVGNPCEAAAPTAGWLIPEQEHLHDPPGHLLQPPPAHMAIFNVGCRGIKPIAAAYAPFLFLLCLAVLRRTHSVEFRETGEDCR